MDSLERELIELTQFITKLRSSEQQYNTHIRDALIIASQYAAGSGNDIINVEVASESQCQEGPPGPPGPPGPQGDKGEKGDQGPPGPSGECTCKCKTILVSEDYTAQADDCYIGVNSNNPVTISLPIDCEDSCEITIKAEMGPPLGNRKITVVTQDGSTIDGDSFYVMSVPYESVSLICRGNDWHII